VRDVAHLLTQAFHQTSPTMRAPTAIVGKVIGTGSHEIYTIVAAENGASIGPSVDALRVAGSPIDGYHHIVV
jgi:hypothetical protein